MSRRRIVLIGFVVAAALPATASAGAGFTVPSRNTTCGILTAKQAGGGRPGLYCQSSYIEGGAFNSFTGRWHLEGVFEPAERAPDGS